MQKNEGYSMLLGNLQFREVKLTFEPGNFIDTFAFKNNKTLRETLKDKRYNKFKTDFYKTYSRNQLDMPFGEFLQSLKREKNNAYHKLLNNYGDEIYCRFTITDPEILTLKGLYCFTFCREIKYIGKCRDSFKKRINDGYGKIHPKNCYLDGQSTNCRINNLIYQHRDDISFWISPINDDQQITESELDLISQYTPAWNIA